MTSKKKYLLNLNNFWENNIINKNYSLSFFQFRLLKNIFYFLFFNFLSKSFIFLKKIKNYFFISNFFINSINNIIIISLNIYSQIYLGNELLDYDNYFRLKYTYNFIYEKININV